MIVFNSTQDEPFNSIYHPESTIFTTHYDESSDYDSLMHCYTSTYFMAIFGFFAWAGLVSFIMRCILFKKLRKKGLDCKSLIYKKWIKRGGKKNKTITYYFSVKYVLKNPNYNEHTIAVDRDTYSKHKINDIIEIKYLLFSRRNWKYPAAPCPKESAEQDMSISSKLTNFICVIFCCAIICIGPYVVAYGWCGWYGVLFVTANSWIYVCFCGCICYLPRWLISAKTFGEDITKEEYEKFPDGMMNDEPEAVKIAMTKVVNGEGRTGTVITNTEGDGNDEGLPLYSDVTL